MAASFLIEGLQKFEQYTTINPINVEIINLILETNYHFIEATINVNLYLSLIVYFLVQQLQKKQTLFLLLPMS